VPYVEAYCHKRNDERVFRADRIRVDAKNRAIPSLTAKKNKK
jgi:predicted DNA-binding transcriptional regulator YafY